MIIQNPLLTGSLNYNGADLSNVTSSNANSASVSLILTAVSSSNQQLSASYISLSGSYNIFSGSASTRITKIENNYATTGSNSFRADQSITGSLVVSSTITAQTLVVQTVTSSIVYSSGSNIFGSQLANRQTFTGSIQASGSSSHFFMGASVGIGVTNPGVALEVNGYGKFTGIGINSTPSSIGTNPNYVRLTNTGGDLYIGQEGSTSGTFFNGSLAYDSVLYSGRPYNFIINGVSRMYISSSGNVGIGNTNPGAKLEIESTRNSTILRLTATSGENWEFKNTNTVGSTDVLSIGAAGATANLNLVDNGNVGIGTSNPQSIFHIGFPAAANSGVKSYTGLANSHEGFLFDYYYNTAASNLRVFDIAALGASTTGIGGSDIRFLTVPQTTTGTPIERLRITNAGYVGIGTSGTGFNAAGLPLVVGGGSGNTGLTIFSGATSAGSIHFADAETTGAGSYAGYINYDHTGNSMQFGTNGPTPLERMKITSGGTVFYKGYFGANLMGGFSVIGTLSAINVADRYLHARINTIGAMMYWIKVFGYVYTTTIVEGLGGGYVGGGTGAVQQAFQNGNIVAQYQNDGYVEIVVDTLNASTTNRWGSITFLGGSDTIATVQPLEIIAYSWTSTITRVY